MRGVQILSVQVCFNLCDHFSKDYAADYIVWNDNISYVAGFTWLPRRELDPSVQYVSCLWVKEE